MQTLLAEHTEISDAIASRSHEMDRFEGYARPHGARVAAIADSIAASFNLAHHDRSFLTHAAYLHDIGEVVMAREYFSQSHVLTSSERLDMQRHPVIGEQEIARMGLPRGVQLLVRWHHEWWNGSGYPDGLERSEIPLASRILRVADSFASLTEARPFRAALPVDNAHKYLIEWSGIEFDPKVVKGFLALEAAHSQHQNAVAEPNENA